MMGEWRGLVAMLKSQMSLFGAPTQKVKVKAHLRRTKAGVVSVPEHHSTRKTAATLTSSDAFRMGRAAMVAHQRKVGEDHPDHNVLQAEIERRTRRRSEKKAKKLGQRAVVRAPSGPDISDAVAKRKMSRAGRNDQTGAQAKSARAALSATRRAGLPDAYATMVHRDTMRTPKGVHGEHYGGAKTEAQARKKAVRKAQEHHARETQEPLHEQRLGDAEATKLAAKIRKRGAALVERNTESATFYGTENTHKRASEGAHRRASAGAKVLWGQRLQQFAEAIDQGYRPTRFEERVVSSPEAKSAAMNAVAAQDRATERRERVSMGHRDTTTYLRTADTSYSDKRRGLDEKKVEKAIGAYNRLIGRMRSKYAIRGSSGADHIRMPSHADAAKLRAAELAFKKITKRDPGWASAKTWTAKHEIGWKTASDYDGVVERTRSFLERTEPGKRVKVERWPAPDRSRTDNADDRMAYAEELEAKRWKDPAHKMIAGYFPTPYPEAALMVESADIQPGMSVLEPSAGTGGIADMLPAHAEIHVAEISPTLRKVLGEKGYQNVQADGLGVSRRFDRVVMNPPFEKGQDMAHVLQAFHTNLKPGGRLVAIVGAGAMHNSSKAHQAFQRFVSEHRGESDRMIDPKAWRRSGTGVRAIRIVLDKPDGLPLSKAWKARPVVRRCRENMRAA